MRYAVISAAVFSGAMFMTPGSHVAPNSDLPSILNKPAITTVLAVAPKAVPRAKLADVKVADKPAAPQPVVVTVADGDTLSKLASDNGSTIERVYAANLALDNPDMIIPGQQLRIPDANEQLADRPLPVAAAPVQAAPVAPVAIAPVASASPAPVSVATVASGSVWDQLAQCESGGNWAINTGNGFYGGVQFTLATWQGLGGTGLPSEASRDEQIARAQALQARSGWGQWPACSAKLGLY